MTEYEMVDLYLGFRNSAATSFMDFITALFALLVTAYVVGQKLTRSMVVIIIILFTLFACMMLLATFESLTNMVNIASAIKLSSHDDSALGWMFGGIPLSLLNFAPIVTSSTIIVAYLAALIFFFLVRHHIAFKRVPQDNYSENNSAKSYVEPVAD